jgi:biopolymer transport protein ExbD
MTMERELNQINVIPLVDVMLVLLVIVLTTATFITTGQVSVELAQSSSAGDRTEVPLVVTINAQGDLYVNDRLVSPGELTQALAHHPKTSTVLVRADRVTLLERFVTVIDEIKAIGFRQVSLEVVWA